MTVSEATPRVLLVDDEGPILRATQDLLQELGFEVTTHADASTIHTTVRDLRPGVLLQDVRMPGLDIRALVGSLRADPATRGTRIILFSASIEAPGLAKELGVDIVQKPFKPAEIVTAIRG